MKYTFAAAIILVLGLSACDNARVFDENKTLESNTWHYKTRIPFDVRIKDTTKLYNVYVNLRVDADYKYSNIFMWVHTTNPDKILTVTGETITTESIETAIKQAGYTIEAN